MTTKFTIKNKFGFQLTTDGILNHVGEQFNKKMVQWSHISDALKSVKGWENKWKRKELTRLKGLLLKVPIKHSKLNMKIEKKESKG